MAFRREMESRSGVDAERLDGHQAEGAGPERVVDAGTLIAQFRRRQRRERLVLQAMRILVAFGIVFAWQVFSGVPGTDRYVLIDSYYVSTPFAVWETLQRWLDDGTLFRHAMVTTRTVLIGFSLGTLLGLLGGFLLGVGKRSSQVLLPFVSVAYSIPRLALVPLFLLWFGLGAMTHVMFVTTIVFFLVFFNTYSGVRDVDSEQINALKIMGANALQLHLKVTLPSALTWIIAGLRISAPYALVGAVTAEMIASNAGLGHLLIRSTGQFFTPGVFAAMAAMAVLGLVVNALVALADRNLLKWKTRGMQTP